MKTTDTRLDAFSWRGRRLGTELGARSWVRRLVWLAVVIAVPFTVGVSQVQENGGLASPPRDASGIPPINPLANRHPDSNRILEDAMRTQDNQKRIAELNLQRQKQMTEDTKKLLALANELKTDLDKNNTKDTPSMMEVRKAEMIEKLAHGVRDKMRATVGD